MTVWKVGGSNFKTSTPRSVDELGAQLGFSESFYQATWPRADADVAKEDEVVIPVQVNGKLKARLTVEVGLPSAELEKLALDAAEVTAPKKVIVVPGRLVNIVV